MGLRRYLKNFLYKKKYNLKDLEPKKIINQNILITGANSGIGFSLTKKLVNFNNNVFATYNNNKENLLKIKNVNLKIIKCNQENFTEIDLINDHLDNSPINLIINNVGIWGPQNQDSIENINYEDFKNTIMVNALSVLKITETILKNSKKDSLKTILNISSSGGSIAKNDMGNAYIYRTSKSALNSITKNMSVDLKRKNNINVFCVDPGNVKTKMNSKGILDPDICANNLINILETSGEEINGKFIDLQKNEISW
jgi:short-subunit dehydrogenase|tara:strand:+ start:692 stop:1456 length:765 start_codon:yes stop_codon:yes gene_type:complete